MSIQFDSAPLKKLDRALANAQKTVSDRVIAGRAMRKSLKPMLEATRSNAPQGEGQRISLRTARRVRAKGGNANSYRKGGATRADQRIKIVKGKGIEVVRGLVGTDKRKGKVGFRTHLITRKNKHRRTADDFLARSETQTVDTVIRNYGGEMTSEVEKVIKRNL